MKDPLKQYIALRDSLDKERGELEARLAEINKVLSMDGSSVAGGSVSTGARRRGRPARRGRRGRPSASTTAGKPAAKRGRRAKNSISLYEAVAAATKNKPLTKQEILAAIDKMGYKFKSKNPANSLSTVLYGKNKFKNVGGKFSPPE